MTAIVPLLMILIGITSLVAIWYVVGAIARMSPRTRLAIRAGYIAKATGLATILAAVIDHFAGAPYTWPWLMLGGVALANAGGAAIHVFNARDCHCPECPVRRVFLRDDKGPAR